MRFDEHFLKVTLSEFSIINKKFPKDAHFSVDSRTIEKGNIFIALQGNNFDGHMAIEDALKKGSSGIFLEDKKKKVLDKIDAKLLQNKLIVSVPNTLEALIKLATAWRSQFDFPVVAITGSIGKTTTKEMVSNILEINGTKHIASYKNQNTKIGLSLNILKMRSDHKAAIFELGISKRNDMSQLADILKPTTALITCIGHSHMEGLGSLTDIASEKRQVFKYFNEDSIGIVNGDQPILANVAYDHPVIKFGSKTTNQIQARKIHIGNGQISFILKMYKNKYRVVINNTHSGGVFNALAAATIAHLLSVPNEVIVKGIQIPIVVSSRFEKLNIKENKGILISDCYNASPESMKASLFALEQIDTNAKKIAILGDMLELGVNSPFWHRQLGRVLRKAPSVKHVILVGENVTWAKKTMPIGISVEHVQNWKKAISKLENILVDESLVLVKGSNSMNLTNLVDHFTSEKTSKKMESAT